MSEATVRCPKCGHDGIVITELLNSNLRLIADSLQAENAELKQIFRHLDIHQRRCHDCGNVAWHKMRVFPYVECFMCGSQDTRDIRRRDNDE
jgi:DNA-directed RNA polymerase subunit RPC12/RpoP